MMSRTPKLAAVAVLAAFSGLALQVNAQETVELDEVKSQPAAWNRNLWT